METGPGKRQRAPRRALRLPVKFWRTGERQNAFSGFTSNVSAGGLFVNTWRPLPPNASIELSIEHPERTLTTSATVVHAARYPPQFARVYQSGMGIQFHRPEDPGVTDLATMGQLLPDRGGRRRRTR